MTDKPLDGLAFDPYESSTLALTAHKPIPGRTTLLLVGVLILTLPLGCWWFMREKQSPPAVNPSASTGRISAELSNQVARLEAREAAVDRTVWAKELLAQRCGRTFETLWDTLKSATNPLAVMAQFQPGQVILPSWREPATLPHDIVVRESEGAGKTLSTTDWAGWINGWLRSGWTLVQTEFRHLQFDVDEQGAPNRSRFQFSAHLVQSNLTDRAALDGTLVVSWATNSSPGAAASIRQIDAHQMTLKTRRGQPALRCVLRESIDAVANAFSIDPLIVNDLDGDGNAEIILAARNLVYQRQTDGRYRSRPLCSVSPGLISTAILADFDGDGWSDFLVMRIEGLVLFRGDGSGEFHPPERLVWPAPPELKYPMTLSCGDVDGDGDLDLFVGQYKVPYELGAMPTPFWDANDGYPAFLLQNDGKANFTDVTVASGLVSKRCRRTYAGSLVDLDADGHLDLAVVSDFAGIDLYRNDGEGRFAEATRQWISEPHAFGMAHAVADFNRDGRLDVLMLGMPSPAADRLEHLGLWRSHRPEDRTMRARMTHGNHLYLARAEGGFSETEAGSTLARSGWSWGCSAFDLDNDSWPDVYIANGLESRESVRDYEPEYWLHDLFVGDSKEESAAYLYFSGKFSRTRGSGHSYGGYEKNRLYLNQAGRSFVEVGHLFGVALEEDSRNVVSADLDGDGRMDLVVTSFEPWPKNTQVLRLFKNEVPAPAHWIGFRFPDRSGGASPIGATVRLRTGPGNLVRQIITGDSHRSQHPNSIHFGLGEVSQVEEAEITWPDGRRRSVQKPALNRWHTIQGPERKADR